MVRSVFIRPQPHDPLHDLIYLHPLSQRSGRIVRSAKKFDKAPHPEALPEIRVAKPQEIDPEPDLESVVEDSTGTLQPPPESLMVDRSTIDAGGDGTRLEQPEPLDRQAQLNQQVYELAQKLRLLPQAEPSHPLLKRLHQSAHRASRAITVPYWREIPLPKWPVICLSLAGFAGGTALAALVGMLALSPTPTECQTDGGGCPDLSNTPSNAFTPLTGAERDEYWLTEATVLKSSRLPNQPLYQHLASLWVTRSQLRQPATIDPAKNEPLVKHLEQQIQDATQIQLAQLLAGMYQVPSWQVAIHLTQAITPDRPYYAYAQTLLQQWQQVSQRAEDHPYLETAQRLALTGKVEDLKAAIVQAQTISPGRASRQEAQALIFRWTRQVQTQEDRPLLEQAQSLAQQNKLEEAIRVADQIAPGRIFSETAQTLVRQWRQQLYLASGQAILDQATALADQIYLTRAIDLASQITPDQPLYSQAQSLIADWSRRRTEYWQAHAAETAQTTDRSSPEPTDQTNP